MGSLYAKPVVETALNEVGYQAGADKWNKYADELDRVDYFVGCGSKQYLNWCCVFVCWCMYRNTLNSDSIPEPLADVARYFQYQSDVCNTAAVVSYMAQFYKDHNAFVGEQEAGRGDVIFYQKSNGVLYHVGLVVDWGYFDELGTDGFKVVEGNTNGGQVAIKYYKYGDPKIAGFGQPRYDDWEYQSKPQTPVTTKPNDSYVVSDAVIEDLARRCIEGEFGNYPLRKQKINALGYGPIYSKVQTRVNMIIYGR